ncbi:MAG: amphi-Trp domain-containing protein [Pseudomonadota bacterium]
MEPVHKSFRHESLQDADSIQGILESICTGLAKGKLKFSDEQGQIVLSPRGLLNLKVTASEDGAEKRLSLRISWHDDRDEKASGKLKIS